MKKMPEDMKPGTIHKTKRNGDLVIIEYSRKLDVTIRFIDTGYTTKASANSIRNGEVKDRIKPVVYGVGYMGIGRHKSKVNKVDTPQYKCWNRMLERCYSNKKHKKFPTYSDCTVDKIWHSFNNFAEWYEENYPSDGMKYDLDKDIKIDGNRVYGPETCSFVTRQSNIEKSFAKSYTFLSPVGSKIEIYNLSKFCKDNDLESGAMCMVNNGKCKSHRGWRKAD